MSALPVLFIRQICVLLIRAGATGGLRIVGGRHRGRRLVVPPGEAVRPTSDRAREALFNILVAWRLRGRRRAVRRAPVLDAFAGTGALRPRSAVARRRRRRVYRERARRADRAAPQRRGAGRGGPRRRSSPATRPGRRARRLPARWRFSTRPIAAGSRHRRCRRWRRPDGSPPRRWPSSRWRPREEWAPPAGFALIDERVYGAARLVFLRYEPGDRGDRR